MGNKNTYVHVYAATLAKSVGGLCVRGEYLPDTTVLERGPT